MTENQIHAFALADLMVRQFNGDREQAANYLRRRARTFTRCGFHSKARQYRSAVLAISATWVQQ